MYFCDLGCCTNFGAHLFDVLRDDRGSFIAASNNNVDYDLDKAKCGALAARYGMYLANHRLQ